MENHTNRLTTFKEWDRKLGEKLAETGFYYTGVDDIVKCYYCKIEIKKWTSELNPKDIHKKFNKLCPKNMVNFGNRIETFINKYWKRPHDINKFANSGFYYTGIKDIVQCFSCRIKLENWTDNDDPFTVHKEISPKCEYLCNDVTSIQLMCDICAENSKNICFIPCGHIVCCSECSTNVEDNGNVCPICKQSIESTIKVYY